MAEPDRSASPAKPTRGSTPSNPAAPRVARPQRYRGERLGLNESGPGSIAPFGRRAAAFLIDLLASSLVAALFVRRDDLPGLAGHLPGSWSLIPLALDYILGLVLLGRTFGMYVMKLRVVRVDANLPVGPRRAIVRTALLILLIPAVVVDADFRGLHDRLTSTAVIVH
ncbi:RDD family protein [Jatrophihabitans sp. DSM 45814]